MQAIASIGTQSSYEHSFLAIAGGGATERAIKERGVRVTCLHRRPSVYSFDTLNAIFGEIRRRNPAVVHSHGAEANFLGLIAARLARVPVAVAEEVGLPNHTRKGRLAFRLVYAAANTVVAVSESVKSRLIELGEVPADRVKVVESSILLAGQQRRSAKQTRPFRFVFVGRLHLQKALDVLLDAVALAANDLRGAEVCIVGEGTLRTQLEEQAKRLGVSHCVRFLGFHPAPLEVLAEADIFVFPSRSGEGFSQALGEALGMGLPAIATNVAGASQVVRHGTTGWLIPPDDHKALAAALVEAVTATPERLTHMGRAAQSTILNRYTPQRYVAALEALYDSFFPGKAG